MKPKINSKFLSGTDTNLSSRLEDLCRELKNAQPEMISFVLESNQSYNAAWVLPGSEVEKRS